MTLKVGIQADVDDAITKLNKLKKALYDIGAAGKSLNEVGKQFSGDNYKKMGAVGDQFDLVRDHYQAMMRDSEMRRVADMAAKHGHKRDDPLAYASQIHTFYANKDKGAELQQKFVSQLAYGPGASVISGGNMAAQQAGSVAEGGNMAQGSGAFIARNLKWAAGGMLGLAGINSIRQMVGSGMEATQALRESSESIFKRVGTVESFGRLETELKQLSDVLQLTSAQTAKLTDDYIKASGATDGYREQVARSVTFGRGLGMDPGISSRLFAQASLVGYGTDKASQREFAALLAHTIATSHMFARSEQIMEDMVGHLGEVASREGRTASVSEMSAYGSIMGALYKNPAMAGGGGQSFMQGLKGLGTGGDSNREMFSWQAFGDWAGGDFVNMQAIKDASLFATQKDIFGQGSDEITKLEKMWPEVLRQSGFVQGNASQDKKIAYVLKQMTGMNMNLGESGIRLLSGGMGHFKEFKGWAEAATRMKLGDEGFNPESIGMLSRLYEDRGSSTWRTIAGQYTTGGKASKEDVAAIKKALESKDDEALRDILPAIVARTGAPSTPTEVDRKAEADLQNSVQNLVEPMNDLAKTIKEFLANLMPSNPNGTSPFLNDLSDTIFGKDTKPSELGAGGMWGRIKNYLFGPEGKVKLFKGGVRVFPEAHASMGGGDYPGDGLQMPGGMTYDMLSAQDQKYGFPPGTMHKLMMAESQGRVLGYHYKDGATNPNHSDFGYFGIKKDYTGINPGYGVSKLKGTGAADQVAFAAEYLAAMRKATGSLEGGISAYHTGLGNWQSDDGRKYLAWMQGQPADGGIKGGILLNHLVGHDSGHISGLDSGFSEKLSALIEAAPDDIENQIKIISGYRSPERQAVLFRNAVKKYGSEAKARRMVAPPGRSRHNHGLAADLRMSYQAKKWVHSHAEEFGLTFPMSWEPWHIEPMGSRAPQTPPEATNLASSQSTRTDGHHTLDIVIRTPDGKVLKKLPNLALSEPKVFGSDGDRKTWNASVMVPSH